MKKIRPKKDIKPVKLKDITTGSEVRYNYAKEILHNTPIFPKPLEYEDIDIAFKEFVTNEIDIVCEGKEVPTFTLYSNQRFSEYSQTWQHTDENNNLLMNFKTIVRDKNPKNGTNQGGLWNIPGDRKYTLLIRDVLDDNGTESYEIFSMKQPYTVDLLYKVSFVTNKFERINEFNQKINKLFSARQCYIRPNGHFIPMVIEDISDDTEYNVDNRKFYTQSCDIKVMAYIIHEEDFTIEKKPKRIGIFTDGDVYKKNPSVEIEEFDMENNVGNEYSYREVVLTVNFDEYQMKSKFIIDTDVDINSIQTENVRSYRLWVNSSPIYTEKGFKLKEDDEILIKIKPFDSEQKSLLTFRGINKEIIVPYDIHENVSDEIEKIKSINIE